MYTCVGCSCTFDKKESYLFHPSRCSWIHSLRGPVREEREAFLRRLVRVEVHLEENDRWLRTFFPKEYAAGIAAIAARAASKNKS